MDFNLFGALGKLPEADTADMETFFDNARLLLPTLGVNVFAVEAPTNEVAKKDQLVFELRWEEAQAEAVVREGQIVIRAGSHARVKEVDSLGDGVRALRKTLRQTGVLVAAEKNAALLRFTQEYAFDSPSGAAAVVSGSNVNGRVLWKIKGAGTSYKEWQEAQLVETSGDNTGS